MAPSHCLVSALRWIAFKHIKATWNAFWLHCWKGFYKGRCSHGPGGVGKLKCVQRETGFVMNLCDKLEPRWAQMRTLSWIGASAFYYAWCYNEVLMNSVLFRVLSHHDKYGNWAARKVWNRWGTQFGHMDRVIAALGSCTLTLKDSLEDRFALILLKSVRSFKLHSCCLWYTHMTWFSQNIWLDLNFRALKYYHSQLKLLFY